MELRDFAHHILFEATLEAKLVVASEFSDARPGLPVDVPEKPGRPTPLDLRPKGVGSKVEFPSAKALESGEGRGLVLHFFANHELLAMELMALALLRFPDAPPSFRLGLARTIVEEQKHLTLYRDRMQALGVGFGSAPVNRYFWDCIAGMRTPLDYVTQMSLTLEQANLDYSKHYRDLFAGLGDQTTASLLDVVYQEEIGHVKHGVTWFNRWRPGASDDWQEYQNLLPAPLSPVRAKGIGYDREARRLAGLSEHFIDELAVYKHSKGRPPVVYWFNPGCEAEIAHPEPHFNAPAALRQITSDLASLMQFLTRADDVVWLDRRPTTVFLSTLQEIGLPIPQFVTSEGELQGRQIAALEPWGQSPAAIRRQAESRFDQPKPKAFVRDWRIFSKAFSAELLEKLAPSPTSGRTFHDRASIVAHLAAHFAKSEAPLVIKAPFGSSGRNMQRIKHPEADAKQLRWVDNILGAQGAVVIEPWLDRLVDLSVQVNVANGKRPVLGITRFLTDGRGQYIGHRLGRKFGDLDQELRRALHEGGLLAELESLAARVVECLAATGYSGPAGIDALIYRDGATPKLKPIVEINPRYTMGRIAWELDHFVYHAADADWLHLNLKQAQGLGHAGFREFVAEGQRLFPPLRKDGAAGPLTAGFVATNDPEHAALMQTVLAVGPAQLWLRAELAKIQPERP